MKSNPNLDYMPSRDNIKVTASNLTTSNGKKPGVIYEGHSYTGKFSNTSQDDLHKQSEINVTTDGNNLTDNMNMSMNSKAGTNYTKLEVKELIEKIFLNFAKYYKEEKEFLLSQQALLKIIKQLNLLDDDRLKLSDVDLLFRKVNPHAYKLNQKQFMDFIVKLVGKMYPKDFKESPKDCVNLFVASTFEPFSKFIEGINHIQTEESIVGNNACSLTSLEAVIQKPLDSQITAIINSIYFAIKEIYLHYFHYEINRYKDKKRIEDASLSSLTEFCKDFEILPYLINIHQLVTYYNLVMKIDMKNKDNFPILEKDSKDMGNHYTLSRFCLLFIHFSIFSYTKNNQYNSVKTALDCDKLLLFLEKLEYSNGFQNLERKTNKPHTSKLTLIPSKFVLKMIDSDLLKSLAFKETESEYVNTNERENKNEALVDTKVLMEFNEKTKKNEQFDLRKLFSVNDEVFDQIHSKIESLREIFLYYSRLSGKLNFNRLGITSFMKFLKDCEIITEVPKEIRKMHADIDSKINLRSLERNFSKSPLKTSSSVKSQPQKKITNIGAYRKSISECVNFSQVGGKLTLSDVNIIFLTLTGPKNFDNSSKIKQQFDRNSGFVGSFDENRGTSKAVIIDKKIKSNNPIHLKMDFFLFLKSFEVIAVKLYPHLNVNQAILEFFESKLSKIIDNNTILNKNKILPSVMERINQPEIKDLLSELSVIMKQIFDSYAEAESMSFEKFFDFCKDFSLFPDIINLVQGKNIFYTLSEIHLSSTKTNADNSELRSNESYELEFKRKKASISKSECIDFDLFMDSLAMVSTFFKFNDQFKDFEKILYLLERMNQSKGLFKMQKKTGTTFNSSKDLVGFLVTIKVRYPEFYSRKLTEVEMNKPPSSFEDIYGD